MKRITIFILILIMLLPTSVLAQEHQYTDVVSDLYQTYYLLRSDGTVWCWGEGFGGKLGNGSDKPEYDKPVKADIDDVVKIEAGTGSSGAFAIKSDGTLWRIGNPLATYMLSIEDADGKSLGTEGYKRTHYIKELNPAYYSQDTVEYFETKKPYQLKNFSDVTDVYSAANVFYVIKKDGSVWMAHHFANKATYQNLANSRQDAEVEIPDDIDLFTTQTQPFKLPIENAKSIVNIDDLAVCVLRGDGTLSIITNSIFNTSVNTPDSLFTAPEDISADVEALFPSVDCDPRSVPLVILKNGMILRFDYDRSTGQTVGSSIIDDRLLRTADYQEFIKKVVNIKQCYEFNKRNSSGQLEECRGYRFLLKDGSLWHYGNSDDAVFDLPLGEQYKSISELRKIPFDHVSILYNGGGTSIMVKSDSSIWGFGRAIYGTKAEVEDHYYKTEIMIMSPLTKMFPKDGKADEHEEEQVELPYGGAGCSPSGYRKYGDILCASYKLENENSFDIQGYVRLIFELVGESEAVYDVHYTLKAHETKTVNLYINTVTKKLEREFTFNNINIFYIEIGASSLIPFYQDLDGVDSKYIGKCISNTLKIYDNPGDTNASVNWAYITYIDFTDGRINEQWLNDSL